MHELEPFIHSGGERKPAHHRKDDDGVHFVRLPLDAVEAAILDGYPLDVPRLHGIEIPDLRHVSHTGRSYHLRANFEPYHDEQDGDENDRLAVPSFVPETHVVSAVLPLRRPFGLHRPNIINVFIDTTQLENG